MRESKPNETTQIQIPLLAPIVEESVDVTREQPALGAEPPGKIEVVCACGHRGTVKAEHAGRTAECPRCHRKNPVPGTKVKS